MTSSLLVCGRHNSSDHGSKTGAQAARIAASGAAGNADVVVPPSRTRRVSFSSSSAAAAVVAEEAASLTTTASPKLVYGIPKENDDVVRTPPMEEQDSGPVIREMRVQLRPPSEQGSRGARRIRRGQWGYLSAPSTSRCLCTTPAPTVPGSAYRRSRKITHPLDLFSKLNYSTRTEYHQTVCFRKEKVLDKMVPTPPSPAPTLFPLGSECALKTGLGCGILCDVWYSTHSTPPPPSPRPTSCAVGVAFAATPHTSPRRRRRRLRPSMAALKTYLDEVAGVARQEHSCDKSYLHRTSVFPSNYITYDFLNRASRRNTKYWSSR